MHTLNSEPIKFFQLGANSWYFKEGVSDILVELEQLREKAVREEIFLQKGQVVCLGIRELCIKDIGLWVTQWRGMVPQLGGPSQYP